MPTKKPESLSYKSSGVDIDAGEALVERIKPIAARTRRTECLGGIGGSFFTPIINFPEVAILGVGKSQKKQILINGKFQTRTMLPLSLSYDHRIIDGAEAARFNNDLKENIGKNFAYKLAI